MGDATKNFDWREFACLCCGNNKTEARLIEAVQKIRNKVGPIRINSGYRCKKHNSDVLGATHSKHLLGQAADIKALGDDITLQDLLDAALGVKEFNHGGIGIYSWGLHVDIRGHKARWGKEPKGYVPWTDAMRYYKLVDSE